MSSTFPLSAFTRVCNCSSNATVSRECSRSSADVKLKLFMLTLSCTNLLSLSRSDCPFFLPMLRANLSLFSVTNLIGFLAAFSYLSLILLTSLKMLSLDERICWICASNFGLITSSLTVSYLSRSMACDRNWRNSAQFSFKGCTIRYSIANVFLSLSSFYCSLYANDSKQLKISATPTTISFIFRVSSNPNPCWVLLYLNIFSLNFSRSPNHLRAFLMSFLKLLFLRKNSEIKDFALIQSRLYRGDRIHRDNVLAPTLVMHLFCKRLMTVCADAPEMWSDSRAV